MSESDGDVPPIAVSLMEERRRREEDQRRDEGQKPSVELARTVFDASELAGLPTPPREWIVENWIPRGYVTALYGQGGLGKSLLALELQIALAVGGYWLGMRVPRIRTYGCYCEDDRDELHRRIHAICHQLGVQLADLSYARLECRLGMDNILMDFETTGKGRITPLLVQLTQDALNFKAELFLFDTLADGYAGNQNNASEARQFVSVFTRIARFLNSSGRLGAVWVNAHPSRAGQSDNSGTSGSVQWDAAFRSRCYLSEPLATNGTTRNVNARILTRKKANYASRDEEIKLEYQNGALVRADDPNQPRQSREIVFLTLLDQMLAEGQYVSANVYARNFAPRMFVTRAGRQGYNIADFTRAMQSLFESRDIRVGEYIVNRRSHECILRMAGPTGRGGGVNDVPF